jgi:hypothetical protein
VKYINWKSDHFRKSGLNSQCENKNVNAFDSISMDNIESIFSITKAIVDSTYTKYEKGTQCL